jgi:hypothetical protein
LKGQTQADLKQRIVNNAPDAFRVGEVMRLVPRVLLKHEPRVHEAYHLWSAAQEDVFKHTSPYDVIYYRDLLIELGETWPPSPDTLARPDVKHLMVELDTLGFLIRVLGLEQYSWLPAMLWFTFAERILGTGVSVEIPQGSAWTERGKRPKTIPSGERAPEHSRLEDLDRAVTWWYYCEVARRPKKRLAKELGRERFEVQHAVTRVRQFLACIDAPLPE